MEYELGGVGMAVAVSPRRMSLTLTSSPRGKTAHANTGGPALDGSEGRGGSPNTVLYHAFEGVAAAGASPRTASDDGTGASPVDAAAGLQRHLTRAQALVGEGDAAAAVLDQLERFDVTEHLALQTRVLKAERNLLDAQLASDEGALSHIQAMSAAVAEVDDVAAVALSMARLDVLDDAEARLEALRQRQRAMVDSLLAQLKMQREGLRCALDDIAPGLDMAPRRAPEAALAQALEAAVSHAHEAPARGWGARLSRFARSQLPGLLCGALGVVAFAAVRRTASRVSASRAAAAEAAEAADEAADMAAARAAAALRRSCRLAQEHVDLEELGYSRVIPRSCAPVAAQPHHAPPPPPPPADDDMRGALVSSVEIPVCVGAAAAAAHAAATEPAAPPPPAEEHVLEV